ncbi:MAG: transposase [Beijerinckiaceae bacterium]
MDCIPIPPESNASSKACFPPSARLCSNLGQGPRGATKPRVFRGKMGAPRGESPIRQVCKELGATIVSGALSQEHVHIFVEIPPHIAVSDLVQRVQRPLLHRQRQHHGRYRASVSSGARTYRRQPVVIWCCDRRASGPQKISTLKSSPVVRGHVIIFAEQLDLAPFDLSRRIG